MKFTLQQDKRIGRFTLWNEFTQKEQHVLLQETLSSFSGLKQLSNQIEHSAWKVPTLYINKGCKCAFGQIHCYIYMDDLVDFL